MASLHTRDFLGMLDNHYNYPAHPPSSFSSSCSSPPLNFSLRVTESDCSNNAKRVCEEEIHTTAHPALNDTDNITTKRKRNAVDKTLLHGGNVYAYHSNISPLLVGDSITPLRVPLARKASLARFFQKRNERVQNLLLNGSSINTDPSASFLELKIQRKSEAIPSQLTELELYCPPVKRQCLQSLEAQ